MNYNGCTFTFIITQTILTMEAKYAHGRINLGENTWLFFDREDTNTQKSVRVSIVDNETSTISLLAELCNGKWILTNNPKSQTVWNLFKTHSRSVKRIMKNLTSPIEEQPPLTMEMRCLKRRFHLQVMKLRHKLSH